MHTKRYLSFVLILTVAVLMLPNASLMAAEATWGTDYAAALQQAKAENKRILLDFSGSDWCYWCQKMEEDVLSKQAFKDYADKNLVLVLVDTPRSKTLPSGTVRQNEQLKAKFRVEGFPTFVVVSPDGVEVDRLSGYMRGGPDAFVNKFLKPTEYVIKSK